MLNILLDLNGFGCVEKHNPSDSATEMGYQYLHCGIVVIFSDLQVLLIPEICTM